jgi:hypothetical protein
MARTLGQYQQDIHMCKPGAQRALDNFKRSRIELVAMNTIVSNIDSGLFILLINIPKNSRKYTEWMSQCARKLEEEKRQRIDKRRMSRFV